VAPREFARFGFQLGREQNIGDVELDRQLGRERRPRFVEREVDRTIISGHVLGRVPEQPIANPLRQFHGVVPPGQRVPAAGEGEEIAIESMRVRDILPGLAEVMPW
jgi:hypothetical protein